jgi:methionyl-tRNA synthetase
LAGDVIARYYRLTGADVVFVSGSDSHGTPISVKAMNEGVKPSEIVEKYHNEFKETFKTLGFSYDLYTLTMDDYHKEKVTEFFIKLHEKGLLYPKKVKMAFCPECNRFLPDQYLIGTCISCGYTGARGDQCDECGTLIDV